MFTEENKGTEAGVHTEQNVQKSNKYKCVHPSSHPVFDLNII